MLQDGFGIFLNSTILKLLKINPETDMVEYQVEGDKLIITKSKNKKQ